MRRATDHAGLGMSLHEAQGCSPGSDWAAAALMPWVRGALRCERKACPTFTGQGFSEQGLFVPKLATFMMQKFSL